MVVDLRDLMGEALAFEDYDRRMLQRGAARARTCHKSLMSEDDRKEHERRIIMYMTRYERACHEIRRQGFNPNRTACVHLIPLGVDYPLEKELEAHRTTTWPPGYVRSRPADSNATSSRD